MEEVGMMSYSTSNLHEFENSQALVENLSQKIAKQLQQAIDKQGKASLIVSGGSTPKPLFEKLSTIDIEWSAVTVGLCDERWVDANHKDSNEKLVREYLLQARASGAKFSSMYREGVEAVEAIELCEERITQELLPLSVVILGMGTDAHTASLFPHNPKLAEGLSLESGRLCVSMKPADAPHQRMSLTLPAILGAEHIYLHFEGEQKRRVYEEAVSGEDAMAMPIRSILNQKNIEVYCR